MTSERPPKGPTHEAAHKTAETVSAGYTLVADSIQGLFRMVQEPDERVALLENVWQSEHYAALTKTEQEAIRARYGTGTVVEAPAPVVETPKEAAPATTAAVETPPAAAWPERRENGKPPLKRVFKQYRIAHDGINDKLILTEDVDVYDDAKGTYETKQGIPTKIAIPEKFQERVTEDAIAKLLTEAAGEVRRELDKNGLKLFLDEARWEIPTTQGQGERTAVVNADGSVKRLYLKWKYKIGDTQRGRDFLDLSEVPDSILKLLKDDKDYWKRPEWKKWFGVQMQKKREEIISQELLRAAGTKIDVIEGPDMDVQTSAEIEETDEAVEAPKPAAAPAKAGEPLVTSAPTPKVDTTPAPAPAPAPTPASAEATAGKTKVDVTPPAPAAAPKVDTTPDAPKEVSAEQLHEDIFAEVRRNVAAYRKAYGTDLPGLANRVIGASFVLLTEKYALAKAAVDAERLFLAIKESTEAELGLATPKAEKAPEAEAKPPEAPKTETGPSVDLTPETESAVLLAALQNHIRMALANVDHNAKETEFMAASIRNILLQGKKVAHVDYVPGKSFAVKDPAAFAERLRTLHKGLRAQD